MTDGNPVVNVSSNPQPGNVTAPSDAYGPPNSAPESMAELSQRQSSKKQAQLTSDSKLQVSSNHIPR